VHDRSRRYVDRLARHRGAIVLLYLVAVAASAIAIVWWLPVRADLVDLLPQDASSVVAMRVLETRVTANDTVLVVVRAIDRNARERVERELATTISELPTSLVPRVIGDRADARAYAWEHRFVLAPLDELQRIRDALRRRIDAAKLAANPIYVDLEDRHEERDSELEELRRRGRELEDTTHRASNVSRDGRVSVLEVKTAVAATNVDGGKVVLEHLETARRHVLAHEPGAEVGFAGDLVTAVAEHDAIVAGIVASGAATAVLVTFVLLVYFRSVRLVVLLAGTLATATAIAFGLAAATVGHLNAATAFLGSIIAGNGINYGILLIARFLREREAMPHDVALAVAIRETIRPTLVASLGAAVAYGGLGAASFRGFAEFAVIGSLGMLVCWAASFTLLPVLILWFARDARPVSSDRWLDRVIVAGLGIRRRVIAAVAIAAATAASGVIAFRFVASDPYEYDMRELGSVTDASEQERHWMAVSDRAIGRGIAGRTVLAADRPDQVGSIVERLQRPELRAVVGSVLSIQSFVPPHQSEKRALLGEIREMIDDADEELSADDRAQFRPPDAIAALEVRDLPPSLVELFTERSGRVGLLVSLRPAAKLDELDGHDMLRFSRAVAQLQLPGGETVTTSGASIIFSDILSTIERDGPRVVALVAVGLVALLLLVVGVNARSAAVLAATAVGALWMIAACAMLRLRVTFLDFVALPVTLGLGVDYAINLAHGRECEPVSILRRSGPAVFICSLTTMIGYGSLIVSDNLAIRSFGRASLIGEVTTLLGAILIVPLVLGNVSRRAVS
jgi:predicted RND superfamily exporter protein